MRSASLVIITFGLLLGCSSKSSPAVAPVSAAVPARTTTFTGRARSVEGRAVLFTTEGKRLLIASPGGAWPSGFEGRLVTVSGELQANSATTGAPDDLEIVVNAQVKLLE
jgi:hypothetical protein